MALQVVGRLKTETWTDKVTNQPRKAFKVVADQVNRVRSFGQVHKCPLTARVPEFPASNACALWLDGSLEAVLYEGPGTTGGIFSMNRHCLKGFCSSSMQVCEPLLMACRATGRCSACRHRRRTCGSSSSSSSSRRARRSSRRCHSSSRTMTSLAAPRRRSSARCPRPARYGISPSLALALLESPVKFLRHRRCCHIYYTFLSRPRHQKGLQQTAWWLLVPATASRRQFH